MLIARGMPKHENGQPLELENMEDGMDMPLGYKGFYSLRDDFLEIHRKLDRLDRVIMNPLQAKNPDWKDLEEIHGAMIRNISENHAWFDTALENYSLDLEFLDDIYHTNIVFYTAAFQNDTKENILDQIVKISGDNMKLRMRLMCGIMGIFLKAVETDIAFWTFSHHIHGNLLSGLDKLLEVQSKIWLTGFSLFRFKMVSSVIELDSILDTLKEINSNPNLKEMIQSSAQIVRNEDGQDHLVLQWQIPRAGVK